MCVCVCVCVCVCTYCTVLPVYNAVSEVICWIDAPVSARMRMGYVFYTVCYLVLMSGGKKDGVVKSGGKKVEVVNKRMG